MEIILVMNEYREAQDLKKKIEAVYTDAGVTAFQKAEAALDFGKKCQVDICYTEVVLGGMSGIALVKELRKKNNDILVNFISDTDAYALDGWKLHINDYLLKPVTESAIRHSKTCYR